MKKILSTLAILAVFLIPVSLVAQQVQVAGTILDSSGNPYSYGTISWVFIPGTTTNPGTGARTTPVSSPLNSAGAFSAVTLGDLQVLGGGGKWQATVCTATGACYTVQLGSTTITGSSVDVSAVLSAAAPPATGTTAGYTFGAATGSTNMFTVTDTTSNTGTGAVGAFLTAASSSAFPWEAAAGGTTNGWKVDSSGILKPLTVNTVGIGTAVLPVTGVYLGQSVNSARLVAATFAAARTVTLPDPGAAASVSYGAVQYCGTTATCANTAEVLPKMVFGSVAFPTATTVALGSLPFTSSTSYACTANDLTTPAATVNASTYTSGAAVTFTETSGTTTDVMRYICLGF